MSLTVSAEQLRSYKIVDSIDEKPDDYDEFAFVVRRKFEREFNGQTKHVSTAVDIKSALLRNVLREMMKDVRSVSLVEDKPSVGTQGPCQRYSEAQSQEREKSGYEKPDQSNPFPLQNSCAIS